MYVNTKTRPWLKLDSHPRRAGVSSMGFGGANFHFTVEEYRGVAPKPLRIPYSSFGLLLFSGSGPAEIKEHMDNARSALHAAGVIPTIANLLKTSRKRGELMASQASSQETDFQKGAMTAVFASVDRVEKLLEENQNKAVIANDNGPGQVVISGAMAEIIRAEEAFSKNGISFHRLTVFCAFHYPLIQRMQ